MTMDAEHCLSDRHLTLFGAIIRWYARHEQLMLRLMAAVAGCDGSAVMILTSNLDFNGRRSALLDLLRHRATPLSLYDRICHFLTVPGTILRLRNDIAHSPWTAAPNTHLIQPVWIFRRQPGVKPLHGDPDDVERRYVECDDDKLDYSLEDLESSVRTLAENYQAFAAFVDDAFPVSEKG
jgi:hypothetical protein